LAEIPERAEQSYFSRILTLYIRATDLTHACQLFGALNRLWQAVPLTQPQGSFAEQYHLGKALLLHRAHPSYNVVQHRLEVTFANVNADGTPAALSSTDQRVQVARPVRHNRDVILTFVISCGHKPSYPAFVRGSAALVLSIDPLDR
jgi:hypothetical protein